jgi:hypothetical protein
MLHQSWESWSEKQVEIGETERHTERTEEKRVACIYWWSQIAWLPIRVSGYIRILHVYMYVLGWTTEICIRIFVEMKVCFTYFFKYSFTYVYEKLSELYVLYVLYRNLGSFSRCRILASGRLTDFFKWQYSKMVFFFFIKMDFKIMTIFQFGTSI